MIVLNSPRFELIVVHQTSEHPMLAGADLIAALTAPDPYVPSVFCYDDAGSKLFELRCQQPEYYLRRLELRLLETYLPCIVEHTGMVDLVELGCGTSVKTVPIAEAYRRRFCANSTDTELRYIPIDVNRQALEDGVKLLLRNHPALRVRGYVACYEEALNRLAQEPLTRRKMALFLGSTIGNFADDSLSDFLSSLILSLSDNDYLLLGADLLKDPEVLARAYDDRAGVGRSMEMNALVNINRLFDGNFDPNNFDYIAVFEEEEERVAARLQCLEQHAVALRRLDFGLNLRMGDTIRIGNMQKFRIEDLRREFSKHRFQQIETWTDDDNWYALMLFQLQKS